MSHHRFSVSRVGRTLRFFGNIFFMVKKFENSLLERKETLYFHEAQCKCCSKRTITVQYISCLIFAENIQMDCWSKNLDHYMRYHFTKFQITFKCPNGFSSNKKCSEVEGLIYNLHLVLVFVK